MMARPLRIGISGRRRHLTVRGNERRKISGAAAIEGILLNRPEPDLRENLPA
jgi:hypothetical protein